jgi:hypothetical protein
MLDELKFLSFILNFKIIPRYFQNLKLLNSGEILNCEIDLKLGRYTLLLKLKNKNKSHVI